MSTEDETTEEVAVDTAGELALERSAPLSHEQEQLWSLHQVMPGVPLGNACATVILHGPLDADALRESLGALIQRHEIWRTVFPNPEGPPMQVVQAKGQWTWSEADVSELAETQREEEALRRADVEAKQPFDLARGPLVRALLVRLGEEEHRLFLTLHRIIFDRESLAQVVLPELWELYEARVQGRSVQGDGPPRQYADYATWQHDEQRDDALVSGRKFWREYLVGAPTVLELPRDHPRPRQQSYRARSHAFAVSDELTTGLRELGRQAQATLRTTLTTAFATLLYRYTGQEDLLVGLAVSGHDQAPWQRTVGCFVNTVVLRADLSDQPDVLELLKRTRETTEATRLRDDVPFAAVAHELAESSSSHHPLVQVLLSFEPRPPLSAYPWELAPRKDVVQTSEFDLCLELDEQPAGLSGRFVYNSDLFEPETISRMVEHWQMVLEAMVADPRCSVGELQLMAPREREQVLSEWSVGRPLIAGPDIAELIAEQAETRPDAVAVDCEGTQLSYWELNERADQLARYLRAEGVKPDVPVGVCLERSPDQVIALMGILKAGGGYVPLDPEAPAERVEYVVRDTQMPLVLTQPGLQDKVSGKGAEVVNLDRVWDFIGGVEDEPIEEAHAEQLAYILYTSGSTGQPKGVMLQRGSLSSHSRAMMAEYGLGPQDRVLQFSQYTADASLEQILPALAAGARLVMRGTEIWTPGQLLEHVKKQQVTVMNLWPAYWRQAMREWTRTPQELTGTKLRLVILGGERLGALAVNQWRELGLPGVRLCNAYGPTETTITATLSEAGEEQEPITIGRPLAGRSVYILDRGGRPVPVGVVGELHIGGVMLARGYLNRPDLTTERFVPDPFGTLPGGRLYRTGDLVRYLGDGRIEYIGREDEQVKIRGYRIELGEVEAAISQHPAVEEAVVVAPGDGDNKELVAYVVARTAEPLHEELRSYLEERLPRYMQPAAIAQLTEFPRLASGKPDRRRLPEVERGKRTEDSSYVAPQSLTQQQLVEIWEELLEPRPIGITDNFFHLGGHSLLAAELVSRIEEVLGTRLALSSLFAKPTIEQLAVALREGEEAEDVKVRVLRVQAEGSKSPFFFLHGDWTRSAFYCFALARGGGADQPFYVLEPYNFTVEEGAPTVEAIAAAHIEAMRSVQAAGPYRLGGFCNGGLLAYEMVRQLEAAGEQVEFLGLINPSVPIQISPLRTVCATLSRLARVRDDKRADLYLRVRHALRHLYRLLQPGRDRVQDFGQLLVIEPRLRSLFPPRDALYKDYVGVLSWSAAAYKTAVFGGKVTFFWAREEPRIARRWQPLMSHKRPVDTEEHTVAGTHMSCVTDHIDELAQVLGESLGRVGPATAGIEPPTH